MRRLDRLLSGRILPRLSAFAERARDFVRTRRGNVAMIVALSLVPITIAAGSGVDIARAIAVRSQMARALDAAGLAMGASQSLSASALQALAKSYFDANYTASPSYGTPTLTVTKGSDQVVLTASLNMPTTLMNVVGIKSMPVSFTSTIVWGQSKLWVSLVLDNTGSMCEPHNQPCQYDTSSSIKINALKSASHSLLKMLKNASSQAGDVKVSIVPFNRDVNVGSSNYNAAWLDWSDWEKSSSGNGSYQYPSNCNNGNGYGGYGGYNGYGGVEFGGYSMAYNSYNNSYNNGGYNNGGNNGGYNNGGYNNGNNYGGNSCNKVWVPNDHNTWNGCVMDRQQNYDEDVTTPTASDWKTLFPTEQYSSCPVAMLGLTDDWTALGNKIDEMVARGNTNQTIGLVWGWQTLTDGDPMNPGALPDETQRVIILLSDGLNTQNRWNSSQSSIDNREKKACDNAKAAGIIIYTVYVDLNNTTGSSDALEYCASDSSKYFDLTSADQIATAFDTIGTQITNLRVAK